MTIKIPDQFMGINVDGAMSRALEGKLTPAGIPPATPLNVPDVKGRIYVPSVKLYFAKERNYLGKTWSQAQEELKTQNLMMPTPYQFREFLKHLRDSRGQENQKIFKEITEVRDPWRSEWLNARFEKRRDGLYMISENVIQNGKYQTTDTKLGDILMEDKTPGISLNSWLDSNDVSGLPKSKIANGDLYYWNPRENRVAGFDAFSDWAGLYCSWDPDYSSSSLGVFSCAEGASAKNSGGRK